MKLKACLVVTAIPTVVFVEFCPGKSFQFAQAQGVTWEQQAERLQLVSATLLDGLPIAEPVHAQISVGLKAIVSLLPTLNPQVGAKKEKVPSSPVHSVPTLQGDWNFYAKPPLRVSTRIWAGYLPAGTEKLMGIKASLSESIMGFMAEGQYDLNSMATVYTQMGYQYSSVAIKGAITATDAEDSFLATNSFLYLAPGLKIPMYNVWANVLFGKRRGRSTFSIPSSNTNLTLTDTGADASFPFATQIAAGWMHPIGVQVGIAELWVPNRLAMPRMLFAYEYKIK